MISKIASNGRSCDGILLNVWPYNIKACLFHIAHVTVISGLSFPFYMYLEFYFPFLFELLFPFSLFQFFFNSIAVTYLGFVVNL